MAVFSCRANDTAGFGRGSGCVLICTGRTSNRKYSLLRAVLSWRAVEAVCGAGPGRGIAKGASWAAGRVFGRRRAVCPAWTSSAGRALDTSCRVAVVAERAEPRVDCSQGTEMAYWASKTVSNSSLASERLVGASRTKGRIGAANGAVCARGTDHATVFGVTQQQVAISADRAGVGCRRALGAVITNRALLALRKRGSAGCVLVGASRTVGGVDSTKGAVISRSACAAVVLGLAPGVGPKRSSSTRGRSDRTKGAIGPNTADATIGTGSRANCAAERAGWTVERLYGRRRAIVANRACSTAADRDAAQVAVKGASRAGGGGDGFLWAIVSHRTASTGTERASARGRAVGAGWTGDGADAACNTVVTQSACETLVGTLGSKGVAVGSGWTVGGRGSCHGAVLSKGTRKTVNQLVGARDVAIGTGWAGSGRQGVGETVVSGRTVVEINQHLVLVGQDFNARVERIREIGIVGVHKVERGIDLDSVVDKARADAGGTGVGGIVLGAGGASGSRGLIIASSTHPVAVGAGHGGITLDAGECGPRAQNFAVAKRALAPIVG